MNRTTSLLTTLSAALSIFAVAACSGSDDENARTDVKSASSTTPELDDEEEVNDKIFCKVDSDCDSDERCSAGRCAGLDGDQD